MGSHLRRRAPLAPIGDPGRRAHSPITESPPHPARTSLAADLLGNGSSVTVRLDSTAEPPVTAGDSGRAFAVTVRRRWRPWAIAAADIDGSGRRALIVAVYKPTRYLPKPHNCLFVYRYDGRDVHPIWLGSSLGRPFTAFGFTPAARGHASKLITLDVGLAGSRSVAVHTWIGFGFRIERSQGRWRTARIATIERDRVQVVADGRTVNVPIKE